MHIPPRILRAEAEDLPGGRPEPSARDADKVDRIVQTARKLICTHGREAITLRNLAAALRLTPQMIQRHFTDMEALLGEILSRHLQALVAALNKIPSDGPNHLRAKRAAYAAATRTGFGTFSAVHDLFIRHRGALPPDIADPLDHFRRSVGILLAGEQADIALSLLDNFSLDLPQIEAVLERLAQPIAQPLAASAIPAKPVAPANRTHELAATQPALDDKQFRTLKVEMRREAKANVLAWRTRALPANLHPVLASTREQVLSTATQARAGPYG